MRSPDLARVGTIASPYKLFGLPVLLLLMFVSNGFANGFLERSDIHEITFVMFHVKI